MTAWHTLRQTLARLQAEHAQVADLATVINLQRLRWVALTVLLVNALHVMALALQLTEQHPEGLGYRWRVGLLVAHLSMGLVMGACALLVRRVDPHTAPPWARALPLVAAGLGMLFAIAVVVVDQWVTPNITPFLVICFLLGGVFHLRPLPAAVLYLLAFAGFYGGLGLTQGNPEMLLSNRLNGITLGLLGWVLMVAMWRNFATIALQQAQLRAVNLSLQERQGELERLNQYDGLTGLLNRQNFVQLTEQELARARRQGSDTTLLILDLDFFKRVNDTYGHPGGDAVLRHVAHLVDTSVRGTDLVGRLGGEEFMVLLPGTSQEAGRTLADKLCRHIESSPLTWQGETIVVTVSIGLTSTTAAQALDFEPLYHGADAALYQAKEQGRNRVQVRLGVSNPARAANGGKGQNSGPVDSRPAAHPLDLKQAP